MTKSTRSRVLIPLDGSDFSRQIVRVVRNFFEPDDVELILFRAAFPPVLPTETVSADMFAGGLPMAGSYEAYNRAIDSTYAALEKERDEHRSQLADEIQPDVVRLRESGYTVRVQVDYGDPAQCIIDFVQNAGVDLVAMATHGRGGLGRLVMGSVAERVLRSVGVPVLLMRPQTVSAERRTGRNVLARTLAKGNAMRFATATDGSPAAQHALVVAVHLAELLKTRPTVYVIAGEHDDSAQAQQVMIAAQETIEGADPRPELTPLVGYVDDVLLEQLNKTPPDLLVIGPFHDRGAGSQAAIGPLAQRVVQHAPCSVMVVKGHRTHFKRVLICADVDDEAAVSVGAQLAALTNAGLDLVHVISPSAASYLTPGYAGEISLDEVQAQGTRLSSVLQSWSDKLAAEGFDRSVLSLRRGNMPETALELAHSGHYDLIVVGSRSSAGHFPSSAANNLVRYAEASVLVVRSK